MKMMNYDLDGHLMVLWKYMRIYGFMSMFKVIIIWELLKIVSLLCSLFWLFFFNLWWSCNYTGADDVIGDRTP